MVTHPEFIQNIRQFMEIAMYRALHERVHFAKSLGLSMPQFSILAQLHFRGVCGLSEVSERFEITPAAASQLVDKLVQSGLVRREEDPHDRRAKCLNLTDKGKELLQRNLAERYRWVDELAEELTPAERAKITEALEIMTQAAQKLETESIQDPTQKPKLFTINSQ
jgi:DNA-binding MarR family transcriptional regulator